MNSFINIQNLLTEIREFVLLSPDFEVNIDFTILKIDTWMARILGIPVFLQSK